MEGPGTIAVANETRSEASRKTKDGRTITYTLNVLQQPVRARACGLGAKSNTDRRPVDPPPIVELKIYEGENEHDRKEITQSYHADFMLWISLEHARHLARGRAQMDNANPAVVKRSAGQNVCGMIPLERPSPAIYFIYQDLSICHEGRYRLTFSLFEQIKDPKDDDPEDDPDYPLGGFMVNRLEVRSEPFTVYSAKKFPGLAESTELSRIVAEQGCRVRIRRDVRMRRDRIKKGGKDWDGYDEDKAVDRNRMSSTPVPSPNDYPHMNTVARPRSSSNVSLPSLAPGSRRPSLQETQSSYGLPSPHAYANPYTTGPPAYPSYPAQPQSMQPPPPTYPPPNPTYQPTPALPPHQPTQYGYGPPPPFTAPQHQSLPPTPSTFDSNPYSHRGSIDYSSPGGPSQRRSSSIYPPAVQSPQTYPTYQPPQQSYSSTYSGLHGHHSSLSSLDGSYTRPAPAEPPTQTTVATTLPSGPFADKKLPPLITSGPSTSNLNTNIRQLEPSSPAYAGQQHQHYPPTPLPLDTHKRSYGQVFHERHLDGPLRQGARPPTHNTGPMTYGSYPQDENPTAVDDVEGNFVPVKMCYRRADGRQVNRNLPPHD